MQIVEFMVRSGLKVYVLCDDVDHDTEDALVLLLENLTDEQINEEVERLRVATFFEAGTLEEYTAEHMTRAQKLNQLHVVVDRALSRVRDNGHLFRHFLSDDDNEVAWERDVVIGQGPLHGAVVLHAWRCVLHVPHTFCLFVAVCGCDCVAVAVAVAVAVTDLEFNEDFFKRFTARNTCTTLQLDPMLTELREHFGTPTVPRNLARTRPSPRLACCCLTNQASGLRFTFSLCPSTPSGSPRWRFS